MVKVKNCVSPPSTVRKGLFLIVCFLLPILTPTAVAWNPDGFLSQEIIGGERLRLGDEFGCHGIPGKDIRSDTEAISECRDYLMSQINASKWGDAPLSFGLPEGDIGADVEQVLLGNGFRIVGDQSDTDRNSLIWNLNRSGGSLEKNVASITEIEAAVEENGFVNMYWEAEIGDLNVRRDRDVLNWIETQPFWFTTWGEWYSSTHPVEEVDRTNRTVILKGTAARLGAWDVPGNSIVHLSSGTITSIERIDGGSLTELTSDERHLMEGYRLLDNNSVAITVNEGANIQITWSGDDADVEIIEGTFNNLTPFMAVGHHTIDLFEWSSPFMESPLRFTWLIEPKPEVGDSWILPLLAIVIAIVAPMAIYHTINQEKKDREKAAS